jgi:hypothetical protein
MSNDPTPIIYTEKGWIEACEMLGISHEKCRHLWDTLESKPEPFMDDDNAAD